MTQPECPVRWGSPFGIRKCMRSRYHGGDHLAPEVCVAVGFWTDSTKIGSVFPRICPNLRCGLWEAHGGACLLDDFTDTQLFQWLLDNAGAEAAPRKHIYTECRYFWGYYCAECGRAADDAAHTPELI